MTQQPVVVPTPTVPGVCSACLFWAPPADDTTLGHCHFNAPIASRDAGHALIVWPATAANDWCGEWVQGPAAQTVVTAHG